MIKFKICFLISTLLFIFACAQSTPHKHINFLQSFSPDIIYYNLYVSEAPIPVTNQSKSFIIKNGLNIGKFNELTSRISVDLTELLDDGEYFIGVTSVGNNNEESKMMISDRVIVVK